MKRTLFVYILLGITLSALTACSKVVLVDQIYDTIHFEVVNAAGVDMLAPSNPNNILDKISIEFEGTTYYCEYQTKMTTPVWYGLKLSPRPYNETGLYHLMFGEFSPSAESPTRSFLIDFGDGSEKCKVEFSIEKKGGSTTREFYFNGKKSETARFRHTITE